MNALAISSNDPLGMLGGVVPSKGVRGGARGGAAFDNLFSAFESTGKSVLKATAAPAAKTSAASKQIAEAMIRSMLGAQVSAPVEMAASRTSAPAAKNISNDLEDDGAEASEDQAPSAGDNRKGSSTETQSESGAAPRANTGDAAVRAMLGLGSPIAPAPETEEPVEPSVQNEIANAPVATEEVAPQVLPPPELNAAPETAPTPVAPRGSQKNTQVAARTATATPATVDIAAPTQVAAPTAAVPTVVSKQESSPAGSQNAVRTSTAVTVRSSEAAVTPVRSQTADQEIVERAEEPASHSEAPAPLAFSANLTPISVAQAAPIASAITVPAPAEVSPTPQPAVSQPRSLESTPANGETEKVRTVAQQQRESGNAMGGDDRSRERDAQESLKSATSTVVNQASAGAAELSNAWTSSSALAPVDHRAEVPASTSEEAAPQTAGSAQVAEANVSPAPATPQGAVQQIAVRIAPPNSAPVDLHVTERGGEIHVAVRTSDTELQTSLRQDLGSLTSSLERAGYHTETFVPRAAAASSTSSRDEKQGTQQGFSGRGGSQSGSGGKQKGQREQPGASWLEELEQSK